MQIIGIRFCGRYWGQSGHAVLHCICLLLTQSGHQSVAHRPIFGTFPSAGLSSYDPSS
jgi:hypothetical protein